MEAHVSNGRQLQDPHASLQAVHIMTDATQLSNLPAKTTSINSCGGNGQSGWGLYACPASSGNFKGGSMQRGSSSSTQ